MLQAPWNRVCAVPVFSMFLFFLQKSWVTLTQVWSKYHKAQIFYSELGISCFFFISYKKCCLDFGVFLNYLPIFRSPNITEISQRWVILKFTQSSGSRPPGPEELVWWQFEGENPASGPWWLWTQGAQLPEEGLDNWMGLGYNQSI